VSEKALRALKLPPLFYKIYDRLGALDGDRRYVPRSWDGMTMSWYICDNQKRPNLVYNNDENRFYAMRDIKAGEELTTNYALIG
jgi:hypothetical protein